MASLDDILTAIKNLAAAVNAQTSNDTFLAGSIDFVNLTTPTVVKKGGGRVKYVSVIVAGSANGTVYDATSISDTSRPLAVIGHASTGIQVIDMPFQYGCVIAPGTGQTISGSFS